MEGHPFVRGMPVAVLNEHESWLGGVRTEGEFKKTKRARLRLT